MQSNLPSSQQPIAKDGEHAVASPRCPLCSGVLILLHNAYRCARCSYRLCVSCDPLDCCSSGEE
jgi:hypothetical protein